jgi:hypothetical protein
VRRSTGKNPLILTDDHYVDLDSKNPNWDVQQGFPEGLDIGMWGYGVGDGAGLNVGKESESAVVSGPANYDTCSTATNYTGDIQKAKPDKSICVRTSENRYAFITIEKVNLDEKREYVDTVQFAAVVWE